MSELSEDFKEALSSWASGVSVVATKADGLLYGLTVSSFTSVSLDPPMVLVCISHWNRMPALIQGAEGFTVSILARDQEDASNYFASPGREPTPQFHDDVPGDWTKAGRPIVHGAAAWLCCDLEHAIEAGDHTVFLGRVVQAVSDPAKDPLLYFRRGYGGVG